MGLTGNNVVRGHLPAWLQERLQDFCHNFAAKKSLSFDILIQSMASSPNACLDSSLVTEASYLSSHLRGGG